MAAIIFRGPPQSETAGARSTMGGTPGARIRARHGKVSGLWRSIKNCVGHSGAGRHQEHSNPPSSSRQTTGARACKNSRTISVQLNPVRTPSGTDTVRFRPQKNSLKASFRRNFSPLNVIRQDISENHIGDDGKREPGLLGSPQHIWPLKFLSSRASSHCSH